MKENFEEPLDNLEESLEKPKPKPKPKQMISFRLDSDIIQSLRDLSEEIDDTMTNILEESLRDRFTKEVTRRAFRVAAKELENNIRFIY